MIILLSKIRNLIE